jgi:hypothetical protein
MCKKTRFLAVFTAFLLAIGPANAQSGGGVKVYELFTSTNCPACPPADDLFTKMAANDPDIIALGCHVTYFDRAGRRDPMAKIFCDARQSQYRRAGVSPKTYTPQAVINGAAAVVGSHGAEVRSILKYSTGIESLPLMARGGYLDIRLPAMRFERDVDLWLFAFDRGTAAYAYPVKHLTKLMTWDGRGGKLSFPVSEMTAQGFAVIAQDTKTRQIYAAGRTWAGR